MTPERRAKWQAYMRDYYQKRRAEESPADKAERLACAALKARAKRERETPEQREARLANMRERYHRMRIEDPEKYERMLADGRARWRKRKNNDTG
jgi:hypothetical protein